MNMMKSYVNMMWPVFWEQMVEVFNFRSESAKASAKKVNDHHKGFTLARIAREAITKELLVPYVRSCLTQQNADMSVAGFTKFMLTEVQNPNYAFMCDAVLDVLDCLFMYRAGVRSGQTELMHSARALFPKIWVSQNM